MQTSIIHLHHITIRPILPNDLTWVINVHLESFPGFFLTFLGREFLTLLYKNIQCDPDGIVLVALSDKRLEGFIAGVTQQFGFYQRLIKRQKWAFARAAVGALLKQPKIAPRLLKALRRPQESKTASAQACLMSMGVRCESQGKGIGKQLVRAFCQTLAERGVKALCLTTDQENNEQVKRFYQRLGFYVVRTYTTPEGRVMNEYIISLE
jgi:ribosomal protein S18 acetylase RimI-like enzyme